MLAIGGFKKLLFLVNFWHLVIQHNPVALNKPQIGLIVPNLLEPRIILTSFHTKNAV